MKNKPSTTINNSVTKPATENIFACAMHPEIQGKLNDKCSICGMMLTIPVAKNALK